MLRDIALSQNIIEPNTEYDAASATSSKKMSYSFLGMPVCRSAFATLMGVSWSPRLTTLLEAVLSGKHAPPMDSRYMARKNLAPKPVFAEVYSYLQSLYESVAETLPLDGKKNNLVMFGVRMKILTAFVRSRQGLKNFVIYPQELFMIFGDNTIQHRGKSVRGILFIHAGPRNLLERDKYLFSVCPVCVQHKLLIRHMMSDLNGRIRQRALYDRHLASQFADRKAYWSMRASSRLHCKQIVAIIDGMDQGKYATPRTKLFDSHAFDKYTRPRLHVWGLLCHGYIAWLSISDSDMVKGGSTTCELIMHMLVVLHRHGVDVQDSEVIIQLDNTGSSNKNNCVLSLGSLLTQRRVVRKFVLSFLRCGHTHEARYGNIFVGNLLFSK